MSLEAARANEIFAVQSVANVAIDFYHDRLLHFVADNGADDGPTLLKRIARFCGGSRSSLRWSWSLHAFLFLLLLNHDYFPALFALAWPWSVLMRAMSLRSLHSMFVSLSWPVVCLIL